MRWAWRGLIQILGKRLFVVLLVKLFVSETGEGCLSILL